jgi:hypothetical protein
MKNCNTYPVAGEWQEKLHSLGRSLAVKQTVRLFESGLVKVPVAIGFFRPVILLPLGLLSNLPPEQVETILIHELAHLRRKDYLVNIMQRMAEAIFFFNPGLLWISSLLRQEREACCDDVVIAHTRHTGNYLQALVSFQEYAGHPPGYAMAIYNKRNYLLNRVRRMITRENKKLGTMEKTFLVAGMIVMTAFTMFPAQDKDRKPLSVKPAHQGTEVLVPALGETNAMNAAARQSPKAVTVKPAKTLAGLRTDRRLPVDTVPPRKADTKDAASQNLLSFSNISSTTNSNNDSKTEKVSATDLNGKTYNYTKVNGKLVNLDIDGKEIPQSEFGNHQEMISNIEAAIEARREKRREMLERRKDAMAERSQNLKYQNETRNLERKLQALQRKYRAEQNKPSRTLEKDQRILDQKREEMQKLLLKLREKKNTAPTLNGREIIRRPDENDHYVPGEGIKGAIGKKIEGKGLSSGHMPPTNRVGGIGAKDAVAIGSNKAALAHGARIESLKASEYKAHPVQPAGFNLEPVNKPPSENKFKSPSVFPRKTDPAKRKLFKEGSGRKRVTI